MQTSQDLVLLGDIGGTNARFQLYSVSEEASIVRLDIKMATVRSFDGILQRLADGEFPLEEIGQCSIAAAGLARGEILHLSKYPDGVLEVGPAFRRRNLNPKITLVNDFTGTSLGVGQILDQTFDEGEICVLRPCSISSLKRVLVVGPGTGLGVAQLIRRADDWEVLTSEGGNAPIPYEAVVHSNAQLRWLVSLAIEKYGPAARIESLVSGPGLCFIFDMLRNGEGTTDASEVFRAAEQGDEKARQALSAFAKMFGVVLRSFALLFMPEAIVLAGGVCQKNSQFFGHRELLAALQASPTEAHREFLESLGLMIALPDDLGLRGALSLVKHN